MNRRDKDATQMVGNRPWASFLPKLTGEHVWGHDMDSRCYFAFIYSNLFVPVRTPIKTKCGDKQWKRCHLLLARAFIFHIIKCFHQWSSAHSFNSVNHDPDHIAMVGGENPMCCLYKRKEEKERERQNERKEGKKECFLIIFSPWHYKQVCGPLWYSTMDAMPPNSHVK